MNRTAAILLLYFCCASAAWTQQDAGWIYARSSTRQHVVVLPISAPAQPTVIELPMEPSGLYPTPGGKYLFVTYSDSARISLIDAETRDLAYSYELAEGVPLHISFSVQGTKAIVSYADRVAAYDHSQGQLRLSSAGESLYETNPSATVALNRRATRMYRPSSDGLAYFVVEGISRFDTVSTEVETPIWAMAPDYRFLWGIAPGLVTVVDERRMLVVARLRGEFVPVEPAFMRTAGATFVPRSDRAEIAVINDRRFRVKRDLVIPDIAVSLTGDESRGIWILTKRGEILRYDTADQILVPFARLASEYDEIEYVELKPGGGFACF